MAASVTQAELLKWRGSHSNLNVMRCLAVLLLILIRPAANALPLPCESCDATLRDA